MIYPLVPMPIEFRQAPFADYVATWVDLDCVVCHEHVTFPYRRGVVQRVRERGDNDMTFSEAVHQAYKDPVELSYLVVDSSDGPPDEQHARMCGWLIGQYAISRSLELTPGSVICYGCVRKLCDMGNARNVWTH